MFYSGIGCKGGTGLNNNQVISFLNYASSDQAKGR